VNKKKLAADRARAAKRRAELMEQGAKPVYAMLHPKAALRLQQLKEAHGTTDRCINHALLTCKD
jgi:hypothetical protein